MAFELYARGLGLKGQPLEVSTGNPMDHVTAQYDRGIESDYYLEPLLFAENSRIPEGDAVIFFNFRTDRAAQLTERFLNPKVNEAHVHFVAFGPYTNAAPVVFPESKVAHNLGAVIETAGLPQLRIAETEKYAHVTFFFNSQVKEPFAHESRVLVDSPKCPSYAEQPEMSAPAVTDALIRELKNPSISDSNPRGEAYAFIALNFANLDLVGHSGNYAATVRAVETLDACLARLVPVALENGYTVLITGDHGNAEYMIYNHAINPLDDASLDGGECPSHTRNPVPFIVLKPGTESEQFAPVDFVHSDQEKAHFGLQDVAPTVLHLMGVERPVEMTGRSLVN